MCVCIYAYVRVSAFECVYVCVCVYVFSAFLATMHLPNEQINW